MKNSSKIPFQLLFPVKILHRSKTKIWQTSLTSANYKKRKRKMLYHWRYKAKIRLTRNPYRRKLIISIQFRQLDSNLRFYLNQNHLSCPIRRKRKVSKNSNLSKFSFLIEKVILSASKPRTKPKNRKGYGHTT